MEQARLCCLVIVGVRTDGTKELVAVCDGERESTDSWAELYLDGRPTPHPFLRTSSSLGVSTLWGRLTVWPSRTGFDRTHDHGQSPDLTVQ
jgi:hypothetical protein